MSSGGLFPIRKPHDSPGSVSKTLQVLAYRTFEVQIFDVDGIVLQYALEKSLNIDWHHAKLVHSLHSVCAALGYTLPLEAVQGP